MGGTFDPLLGQLRTSDVTPDASSTVKGKSKLSVEPVSDPIAVGDNDPRVPMGIVNSKKIVGCGLATTANITLSGHQTIDGTLTTGSTTVLVKDQTNKAQNGHYTASSGAWTRTTSPIDMSTSTELFGRAIQIGSGTVNANKVFIITNETPPTVGVDDIEFAEINNDPLVEDTTPAYKFVPSMTALMFGDLELYGDILFGGSLTFNSNISASNASIGGLTTDSITAEESTVDTSNNPALAFYNADQTEYMHLDITNHRLSTPVDVPLEVKMGGSTASNYGYFFINGGQRQRVRSVTTNQTINIGDRVLSHTTLAAARTHTLPNSASVTIPEGWSVKILDTTTGTHADTNNITIQRAGTDLFVGGGTNTVINTANGWREIMWVNGRWMVVNTG